jgi:hypothetical protein
VEDQKALETSALISQLTDAVKAEINNFLSNGVMATGVVVGSIFLAGHELLGVEELAVSASADLIDHSGLQIEHDRAGNVLASTGLGEEGVEGIILNANGLVGWHGSIGLNAMFQAEELPAGITGLDTRLAEMEADNFTHLDEETLGS